MSSQSTLRADTRAMFTKNTAGFFNSVRSIMNDHNKYPSVVGIVVEGLNNLVSTEVKERKTRADYHQVRDLVEAKDQPAIELFAHFVYLVDLASKSKDQKCALVDKIAEWAKEHNSQPSKVCFMSFLFFLGTNNRYF
jgi:hypothetical protein